MVIASFGLRVAFRRLLRPLLARFSLLRSVSVFARVFSFQKKIPFAPFAVWRLVVVPAITAARLRAAQLYAAVAIVPPFLVPKTVVYLGVGLFNAN